MNRNEGKRQFKDTPLPPRRCLPDWPAGEAEGVTGTDGPAGDGGQGGGGVTNGARGRGMGQRSGLPAAGLGTSPSPDELCQTRGQDPLSSSFGVRAAGHGSRQQLCDTQTFMVPSAFRRPTGWVQGWRNPG